METPASEPRNRRVVKRFTRQDRRGLFYIISGVVLVYGFFAYILLGPANEVLPGRKPKPAAIEQNPGNFSAGGTLYLGKNGERTVEREYTVDISRLPKRDEFPPEPVSAEEAEAAKANLIQR